MSGFYEAAYSDQYYYSQDLIYTDKEFRDMWEYELNLTKQEQTLILLHLWEIVSKKFDYYFLNKNCAFRIAEILNLVSKKNLLDKNLPWFLPIETFYDLDKTDLIGKIKFIPSNKRIFNTHFKSLSKISQKEVKYLISNNFSNLNSFNALGENDKIEILDFLLLYYKQSLINEPKNLKLKNIKKQVLAQRFRYKPSKEKLLHVKDISSPANNTNPANIDIALAYSNADKTFLALSFSPYKQSSLGISNLNPDELIVLDTRLGLNSKEIFIDKFDLIKIKKINLETNQFLNDGLYSWKLHIGSERIAKNNNFFAKYGIGDGIKMQNLSIYALVDLCLDQKGISITPNINVSFNKNKLKSLLELGYDIDKEDKKIFANLELMYNISKNNYIGFEYKLKKEEGKAFLKYKIAF